MCDLNLNAEEVKVIRELVLSAQGEIQQEIHHTRTPEYKDGLRHRLEVYKGLLSKLGDSDGGAGA